MVPKNKYDEKLKEAFTEHQQDLKNAEKVAEESYSHAWEIITDLRDRLEIQKEEFDQALEEGYEEAYQMLQEERAKNDTLEVDLYEEYDRRFSDIKEYMVDKLDQFLQLQGEKYYDMAKRDVVNDPAVAEHKLAFEKIIETVADYISDEDYAFATSSKTEALHIRRLTINL
jgi:HD-GYP domain-containing protein (c-di-GMP phosphodiesterase class II)